MNGTIRTMSDDLRFFRKVRITPTCWEWTAGKIANGGYGQIYFGGRPHVAHRVALKIFGIPLPDGMLVDHICRNRSCVNPRHLRVVTPRQNTMENSDGIAAKNGAKTHCKHGHPFNEENTAWHKVPCKTKSHSHIRRVCMECDRIRCRRKYNSRTNKTQK